MMSTERSKYTLRKDDMVQVIAGRDKGKTGKVVRIHPKAGRVTVEKINLVKRHLRPSQQNPQGGILEKEVPIHYSNVLLMCPKCNRGVRHGFKVMQKPAGKGKKAAESAGTVKVRVCKKCGESLEVAAK